MSKVATKIKALLTKAERSDFQDESDAFYAKAAELMAKHAIDQAQIDSLNEEYVPIIVKRQFVVMAPYSLDRMQLISQVSMALGGYAYYMRQARDGSKTRTRSKDHNTYAVLIGTDSDLDQIEAMLESINRQLEISREREQDHEYFSGMGQKKVWNATFIRGYAQRIGQRLKEAYETPLQEQTGSVALVLRDKSLMLREELAKIGVKVQASSRQFSESGWRSGQRAAESAVLRQGINS
jgi:hypothetical protein